MLTKVIINLIREQPFYAHLLNQMHIKDDLRVPIAGYSVGEGNIYLHINSFVFNQLSLDNQTRIIIHELLHIIGNHAYRLRNRQKSLWNIACDLAVNQYIDGIPIKQEIVLKTQDEMGFEIIEKREVGGLTLENFQQRFNLDITLPPQGFAEQYYNLIAPKLSEPNQLGGPGQGAGQISLATKGFKNALLEEEQVLHPTWLNTDTSQALADTVIHNAVEHTLQKCPGMAPGFLREQFKLINHTKTPWHRLLRLHLARLTAEQRLTTYKRINKRLLTQGLPGFKKERKLKIVLAIDTSASISGKDLTRFSAEIEKIRRSGAEITLIECDCKIQQVYQLKRPFQGQFQGRGGTDFRPLWQYLKEKHLRPDVIIYLTDGIGPAPDASPYPTIWALTAGGQIPWMTKTGSCKAIDWGQIIHLEAEY